MKIAAVQLTVDEQAPLTNIEKALVKLENHTSTDNRAQIYVLPEMFTCGYDFSTWSEASTLTEYAMEELSSFARSHYCAISGSMPFKGDQGKVYNRMFFIDHYGTLLNTYDKIHLFAPMGEDLNVIPGNNISTFHYDGWKVSMLCCFDLRFPVPFYRCALAGTELFLMCAEWPASRTETMEVLCRARAIETQSYLVMANRVGNAFDNQIFGGNSLIVDPAGTFQAASSNDSDIVTMEATRDLLKRTRERINVFGARCSAVDL